VGYDTQFDEYVTIEPPLNASEISYLIDFAGTRRMNRRMGPLFVDGGEADIIDGNRPPEGQPGLWCQWVPNKEGTALEWDQGEKFYESAAWMKYLIDNLLALSAQGYVARHVDEDPRLYHFTFNHVLNGTIYAQGEDPDDRWMLVVENNVVKVANSELVYGEAKPI